MASTVHVVVNGLAGPRCTVEASTEWTILQVHEAIEEKIGVPVDWQKLVKNTEQLNWEVVVGSLISEDSQSLQLTLLVEEVPEPEPGALLAAIYFRDEALALQLLRRHQVPGLNDLDQQGNTALHKALFNHLQEVAVVIARKPEFSGINGADRTRLFTALHHAAEEGFLPVCRAIVGRADFTGLLALDHHGRTALQVARDFRYRAVVAFLKDAEARPQEVQRWSNFS